MYQGPETCRHCGRRVLLSGADRKCPACGQAEYIVTPTATPTHLCHQASTLGPQSECITTHTSVSSQTKGVQEIRAGGADHGKTNTLTRSRLFEIAVPELYEQNAFRILGLPVDASLRDVRRQQKKMERREKLGLKTNHNDGYLPLKSTPDEDDTRKALHRLQDPVARFLDEFFWFWPRQAGATNDDALALLKHRQVQDAHKLWLQYEGKSSSDKVSTHNLAVLYHVSALDFEQRLLKENLNDADHKTRVGCWQRAYGRWRLLLRDTDFWNRVRKRIAEFDDPQLTPHTVGEIRECLGKVVMLVHARIAVRAAEKGNRKLAQEHVTIMRGSGLESHLVDEALRESVRHVRERITMLSDGAGPRATNDPSQAHVVTTTFLREAQPLLTVIDAILSENDAMRMGSHDEVAGTALRCQVLYGNKTEDWQGSLKLLETVLNFAGTGTETMRGRVTENIETVKGNIKYQKEYGTCYYCGVKQSHDDASIEVPMYGNVRRTIGTEYGAGGISTQYRVTWQHATPRVPRCCECKKHHTMIKKWTILGSLGGFALWLLIMLVMIAVSGSLGMNKQNDDAASIMVAAFFFMPLAGFLVGYLLFGHLRVPYKIKDRWNDGEFPRIKELRAQGWKKGEKPSEVEQKLAPVG